MTEKEKDILIAKMLEAPSSLTDAELDIILLDDELKDIYDCSAAVKGAYMSRVEIDAAREWKEFRPRLKPRRLRMRWRVRAAAAILIVVSAAGIIMKIAGPSTQGIDKRNIADAALHAESDTVRVVDTERDSPEDAPAAIFMADAGATPAVAVAAPAGLEHREVAAEAAEEEIDVDEYLRRQDEEIRREIALINAEIYLDRYEAMMEFIECTNGNGDDEKDANIIIL